MKRRLFSLLIVALIIGFSACQQQSSVDEIEMDASQKALLKGAESDWVYMEEHDYYFTNADVSVEFCNEVFTLPFFNSAMVDIFNDENYIYLRIKANESFNIGEVWFNIWNESDPNINENYPSFPYHMQFEETNSVLFKLVYDEIWETCLKLNIKIITYQYDEYENILSSKYWWLTNDNTMSHDNFIGYCWQDCNYECEPFRTQTPGGWGAPASGNNPGMYRDLNFANAFPNGLVVGVGGDYTLNLTSAAAVEAFLPSGGKPLPLMQNYVDPNAKTLKNTFAGHVVALTLSVVFDAYDENFSAAIDNLGDLEFAEGSGFEGMTVQDILDEANILLGGGSSSYSVGQLSELLTEINEYYVDGNWTGDGTLFKDCWNYTVY